MSIGYKEKCHVFPICPWYNIEYNSIYTQLKEVMLWKQIMGLNFNSIIVCQYGLLCVLQNSLNSINALTEIGLSLPFVFILFAFNIKYTIM